MDGINHDEEYSKAHGDYQRSAQRNEDRSGSEPGDSSQTGSQDKPDEHGGECLELGRAELEQIAHRLQSDPELARQLGIDLGKDGALETAQLISSSSMFSGPIPSPRTLAAYGNVNPSFPERIMRMAEKDQDVRSEALLSATKSESFSVSFATVASWVVPWLVLVLAMAFGWDPGVWIGGIAGVMMAAASIIRATRGKTDGPGKDDPDA